MIFRVIERIPQPLLVVLILLFGVKFMLIKKNQSKSDSSKVKIGNAQNMGERKRQEDSFATLVDEDKTLAVLADGMGGLNSGKEASELVTKNFMKEFCRAYQLESINEFLINTLNNSNEELLYRSGPEKIGTTLIAAIIEKDLLYWVAVGDSHLYLYRDQQLSQLNTEHVFANKLRSSYQAGEISRYQMINHPQKDNLTSYLGLENLSELDYSTDPVEMRKKDKIVLCTDGVYDSLSQQEFSQILGQDKGVQEIAEDLTDKVLKKRKPKQDNATIIVLEKN